MSKKTIIKRAEMASRNSAPEARRVASGTRAGAEGDCARRTETGLGALGGVEVDELAAKVAEALWAKLGRLLPIYARLAAADTVRTVEKPEKVIRRAIDEGLVAAELIRKGVGNGDE